MTVFYPDVSNDNWGSTELTTAGQQALMNFLSQLRGQGLSAVAHKMSQGSGYVDPYGAICQTWCAQQVFPFIGYHYATTDDPANQVANWHCARGGNNVMIDFEDVDENGSATLNMGIFWDLVQAFNAANVNVALAYLPDWYANDIGADLSQFATSDIALVSSAYPMPDSFGPPRDLYRGCDGDTGEGWAPYHGATPTIWQYTDCARISDINVDCNAYRGTSAQLAQLFTGVTL
jgi:lysozyme